MLEHCTAGAARTHLQIDSEMPPSVRHKEHFPSTHNPLHRLDLPVLNLVVELQEPLYQGDWRCHVRTVRACMHACICETVITTMITDK